MKQLILLSACLALLATTALAQNPPLPPAIAATAAWAQQADIQGTVKAFKMTPVGDLEGVILTDGTEITCRRICLRNSRQPCVQAKRFGCSAGAPACPISS
jgi:hypothetical protein